MGCSYIEWFTRNGRVLLEPDLSRMEVVDVVPPRARTPVEIHENGKNRSKAFAPFLGGMLAEFSEENRKQSIDGNVTGIVVG